jgi:hypothetical protein
MTGGFTHLRRGLRKLIGLSLVVAAMTSLAHAGAPAPCPTTVPEIDPGSMLSALTLFSGGLLVMTDRRRGK